MDPNSFPTKGNLIKAKATLQMSKMGYELIDKKRNVLIKEILELNTRSKEIQSQINSLFQDAYMALQDANVSMGINNVRVLSFGMPLEDSISVKTRSIMGVEIPYIKYDKTTPDLTYGLFNTNSYLDNAVAIFTKVKELTIEMSMVETAAYRLALNIKKTQRRANALKNVTIPKFEELSKNILVSLEERERDEFTRLKVIKRTKK